MLAIKVQYPGVRRSIDADVDNVATLLRVSGILPPTLDLLPLLAAAKRQLAQEADQTLFVQRKVSGIALLAARLNARVDVTGLTERAIRPDKFI